MRDALAPLANDPIMLDTSIWLFRHLEHQNPSIISDSIGSARMVQQFQNKVILEDIIVKHYILMQHILL